MYRSILIHFLICVLQIITSEGVCPHEDNARNLKPWSQPSSWPANQVPQMNDNVTITDNILLDTTPPELFGLVIQGGGSLVWSPDGNYSLRLRYIHILGRFDIGSEDCKFKANAKITLIGKRGQYKVGGTEKVILIGSGGTLELHGEEKLSWTKLNGNINKLSLSDGLYYDHLKSSQAETDKWANGLAVYTFNVVTGIPDSFHVFHLKSSNAWLINDSKKKILEFFENVAPGQLVAGAVQSDVVGSQDLSPIIDAFEKFAFGGVTNSSVFRTIQEKDAYAFVVVAGDPSNTRESIERVAGQRGFAEATASYTDFDTKIKISAKSRTRHREGTWKNFVNFRSSNTDRSYPVIDVIDNVDTWHEEDKVVLTSTDYDFNQAEVGTVISCPHCTSKQIRLDLEVEYPHFGEIVHNVDMRGEVALLSRNIIIQGEIQDSCPIENENCHDFKFDTFGGHVKFLKGFADGHIEGVELVNMGQQTDVGSYPFHFHMCEDVDGYANPPYIRKSSIHHTFSRCITTHGTHGVTLMDNTCYEFVGHGYFLEDGGEKRTVIDGNIGINARKGKLLPSDKDPTIFWMTNPQVYLRNNVAAGGEGFGIWFIFPDEPIMVSKGKGFMQKDEARHTAVYEFENNVAHSNLIAGLQFDNRLNEDGSSHGTNGYTPKEDPLDEYSNDKMVNISRLTAYKNRLQNVWINGGLFNFTQCSLSDSQKGITFARSSDQVQFITNSVIIGESKNIGDLPAFALDTNSNEWIEVSRSLPVFWDHRSPVQGFIFYDGPVFAENIWFNGFKSTDNYTAGAIGFLRSNKFMNSPVSQTKEMLFGFNDPSEGNRVYDGNKTVHGFDEKDGDKSATFRDVDGSVTPAASQIVKPGQFYVTSACLYRSNWNMAHCPHKYGKLSLFLTPKSSTPIMVRDDIPSVIETLSNEESAQMMTVLGGTHSYTLHWNGTVPKEIFIFSSGFEKNYWVRFGVCIPRDANFELYSWSPRWTPTRSMWIEKKSVTDLDADQEGNAYYWDSSAGLLFFKFFNFHVRPEGTISECEGHCPVVKITILTGSLSDGNCLSRAYPKYQRPPLASNGSNSPPVTLPVTAAEPPASFGSGSTKPFGDRTPKDGNWGSWEEWGTCSKTCGGGTQNRRRVCNDPIPSNGGNDCVGDSTEGRPCNNEICPTDGGWTEWTKWSKCKKAKTCSGYQMRKRSCKKPKPKNGGLYCAGALAEVQPCGLCNRAGSILTVT